MGESLINSQEDPSVEEIEHTADWAIRVKGKSMESLFQNAALGMLHMIQASSHPGETKAKRIELRAIDNETLLVAFLEELLFNMETNNVNYTGIEVQNVENAHLTAIVHERNLAQMSKEIKAVTFYDLKIEATNEGYITTIVFDV